jgi:hypothetical protein
MRTIPLPDNEVLDELLDYDPNTGVFKWKKFRGNTAKAGSIVSNLTDGGYKMICVNARHYMAHRIAYKMFYKRDPNGILDHIDGDTTNNKIANLRVASAKQNQGNSKMPRHNTSGLKGVTWSKKSNKWAAQIKQGNKKIWLGVYDDKNDAHQAYMKAAAEYFGEFANSGEGL